MLPEEWRTVPIGSIVDTSQYGLNLAVDPEGTTPIIGMKDMVRGRVENSGWGAVNLSMAERNRYLLRRGDILLNRTNSPDLVGKVACWDRDEEAVFPSYIVRFVLDREQAEPEYVNLFLNTEDGQTRLKQISTRGVSQANINPTTFRAAFQITLPPLPEQRRITTVLNVWNDAITKAGKLVAAKERLRSQLVATLYRSVIDVEREEEGWAACRIDDLASVVGGGTPPTGIPAYWNGGIAWCTPTDLTSLKTRFIALTERTISEDGLAVSAASILPAQSVILCSRASVGACAINTVPMATNQGFQSLVPLLSTDTDFLFYMMLAIKKRLTRMAAGSTFLEFGRNNFRGMIIKAPDVAERQRIGRMLAALDDAIASEQGRLVALERQMRGVMQLLISGKLRLPDTIEHLTPLDTAA